MPSYTCSDCRANLNDFFHAEGVTKEQEEKLGRAIDHIFDGDCKPCLKLLRKHKRELLQPWKRKRSRA